MVWVLAKATASLPSLDIARNYSSTLFHPFSSLVTKPFRLTSFPCFGTVRVHTTSWARHHCTCWTQLAHPQWTAWLATSLTNYICQMWDVCSEYAHLPPRPSRSLKASHASQIKQLLVITDAKCWIPYIIYIGPLVPVGFKQWNKNLTLQLVRQFRLSDRSMSAKLWSPQRGAKHALCWLQEL